MSDDKLLNIGPKSAAWLRQVGVRTLEDLKRHGALGTFMKVKRAGFRPSLNLLYALAGAEQGVHWATLSPEYKSALVTEVNALDDAAKQAKKFITPARDVTSERVAEGGEDLAMPEPTLLDEPDVDPDSGGGGAGTGAESSE